MASEKAMAFTSKPGIITKTWTWMDDRAWVQVAGGLDRKGFKV
jgi:hypothetical protein